MDVDELIGEHSDDVPQREPDDECNGKRVENNTGTFRGYCKNPAGKGTDHFGEGRCSHHGGDTPTKEENPDVGNGDQDGNGNAESHGLTADANKWFDRHRDEVEDDVRRMVDSWMEDAPFGWDAYGNIRLLVSAAINECQVRQGDEYIRENNVVVTHYNGTDPVSGKDKYENKGNPVFGYKTQLQNSTLRTLNKLGILDSPESQQADNLGDLASIINEGES